MYNSVITLVDVVTTLGGEDVERKHFLNARIESVKRNEFYQAKSAGFNPEITFVIADYLDYSRERYVDYNGRRFTILRTYRSVDSNALELVCEGVTEDGAV